MATPTPAALDQQAAKLREQAAGLCRRQADRQEAHGADNGARVDDAQGPATATSARSAAAAVTTHAAKLYDRAQESLDLAQRLEGDAARLATSGSAADHESADDLREQAQLLRAGATSYTQRAQRSEQVARQRLDDAERADREASVDGRSGSGPAEVLDDMRHAADSLEDKAIALEQAADELRSADRAFTSEERATFLGRARATLTRANAIEPDLSRVGTDDIVAACLAVPAVPGAELMDPHELVDPVDHHDTDLMDPDAPGSVGAATPDPGDFGLSGVDAWAAPAPTAASLSQDAYMDEPDIGSTGTYSDAYGDGADAEVGVGYRA